MKIRLFSKEDLHAITTLQVKSPEAARWTADDYARLANDPGGKILVAELESMTPPKILGFAAFHRVIDEVELRNMAVDPEHRQQGVAKALLEEARRRMLTAGAKRIFLEVRTTNKPALELYSSLGFAIHSLRKDYYREPQEDGYVLCLEIYPPTVISATP
jgi:ribosomal-protein-alanine N-acetyltransferase